jgi:hypothetical protein
MIKVIGWLAFACANAKPLNVKQTKPSIQRVLLVINV